MAALLLFQSVAISVKEITQIQEINAIFIYRNK